MAMQFRLGATMVAADLKVTGAFDEAFADWAMPAIEKLVQEVRDVTVDMSEASGGDAAGLRALVYLHKKLESYGRRVRVLNASGRVQDVFARYQLADLFIEGAAQQGSTALRSCFFGIRPQAQIPAGAVAESAQAANKNGSRPMAGGEAADAATRDSVQAWLHASTVTGGELRGGDALKSYRRCAKKSGPIVDSGEFRKLLAVIVGVGRVIPRTGGYIVKGVQLRPAAKAPRRRGIFPVPNIVHSPELGAAAPLMLGAS
jgi:anti-anti-sigma regulatory factor